MAFIEENSNTPSGGGIRWILPEGPSLAVASTIDLANYNGAVTLTGTGTCDTITGIEPDEFVVVRAGAGSAITLGTSGNIAKAVTLVAGCIYLLWNNGGTFYPIGELPAGDPPFTPYKHIGSTTMQTAIEEFIDDPLNLPNLTEDTSPTDTTDAVVEWDSSASAYKKVYPTNWGYLKKSGGTMTGVVLIPNGTVGAPAIALSGDTDTGLYGDSTNSRILLGINGTATAFVGAGKVQIPAAAVLSWSPTATITDATDIQLKRGTTRRLDIQADGTNAAGLRILANGTTGTEYCNIAPQVGYTYVNNTGSWIINVASGYAHDFRVNNAGVVAITSTSIYPQTTKAIDLGTTGALYNDAYVARSIQGVNTKTLSEGNPTSFVRISVPAQSSVGGYVEYTIAANDATQFQSRSGILNFSMVNSTVSGKVGTLFRPDGGTVVDNTTDGAAVNSGTLTNTFTLDTSGSNVIDIRANATSSLAQTTLEIRYRVVITSGTTTVTPL